MTKVASSIPVDAETARAYDTASPDYRKKIQVLLQLRLRELAELPTRSLAEIMDDIGARAEARGSWECTMIRKTVRAVISIFLWFMVGFLLFGAPVAVGGETPHGEAKGRKLAEFIRTQQAAGHKGEALAEAINRERARLGMTD
ncbi:MAG: hypothetical protein JRJ86_19735 [Deltaproteobacteria bacterium]|nr:hypothetical protein [Deltaproteobacteria bacterium]MBW2020878.1 hypothetical protein [Deltaproteobacteria bacterium]